MSLEGTEQYYDFKPKTLERFFQIISLFREQFQQLVTAEMAVENAEGEYERDGEEASVVPDLGVSVVLQI